ncbi:guanylate-binding protein 5 isoform X2 [Aotus nancymaae]|uniref:guanylate-binding protein 5 isoform X2 n=1 Tax=Aotus nancymaae TaxID=37293 RepID=UPI0030FE01F4
MAPEIHMSDPVCLIENFNEHLKVNQEALEILSAITQPVVVVAIVGLYRTGKSYLLNKLSGKNKGFSVAPTVQSHTKGIWIWCMPHPNRPNHTLVLLDTEGLGDVEKADNKNDIQIFALALLLSSTFVYNTMNKIDQGAIDLLHNVTELTDLLKARTSPDLDRVEDAADSESFFPDLVWTLRDFCLGLEKDGQLITADAYLENSLRPKQGSDQRVQNFNLPRLCIQKFFPKKKCFIFDLPAHQKKLAQLETLPDDELEPEFVQQVAEFCSYIFSHSMTKTLPGGIEVNGSRLKNLVLTYVNGISSGDLPCMENTVLALAQIENSAAVQKAIAHYDQQMGQKVQLPTETLQELLDLHRASEREAIDVFIKNSFKDVDQSFQKELEAEEVLQKYLKSKKSVSDAILQADQALTEKEKKMKEEQVKADAAKANARRLEEIQRWNQQMMQKRERVHQEQVRQMERDKQNWLAELQRTQEQRMQEQAAQLRATFEAENRRLHHELQYLQRNVNNDDPCVLL